MEKEKGSFRYIIVMYILLITVSVPLFFILRPLMRENIEESGIAVHYLLWKEKRRGEGTADYTVFLSSGGREVKSIRKASSTDALHALLEALLLPLSDEEKAEGYSSYIPEGTTLVGVTEEDGFFFVELSTSFLTTSDIKKASGQIKKTLEENYPLKSLTIISGNTVINI